MPGQPPEGARFGGQTVACEFALDKRPRQREVSAATWLGYLLFMGKKQIIGLVASLILVGASTSLFFTVYGLPLREDTRPHRALGEALAGEALKLGGSGARFIAITRDTSFYRSPALDAAMKGLQDALVRGGAKIAWTHKIKVDPLRATAVPPGDFLQILKKAEDKDIVVSFLGPAVLTDEQVAPLGQKAPRIVAVCAGNMARQIDLKHLFSQGLLRVAVLSKPSADRSPPAADNSQAWFEKLYTVVTPANLHELPAPAGARP